MRKDPTEFRKRFAKWKAGEKVYDNGLPSYLDGKEDNVNTSYSYTIPFINDKAVTLTNAGLATGARLSTNLLDSIADNAIRAGIPIKTALGLAAKESTLGNPTDDRSMRTLLSKKHAEDLKNKLEAYGISYKDLFGQHINPGNPIKEYDLVNYHRPGIETSSDLFKETNIKNLPSVLETAFEFYKQYPGRYNPGLKNHQELVNKRAEETWKSPEVKQWFKEYNKNKTEYLKRPKPYKVTTDWDSLPRFFMGTEGNQSRPIRVGDYNVYPSAIGASELDVTTPEIVITGKDKRPLYLRYAAEHSTYDPKLITNFTGLIPVVGDIQDATMAVDAYNNKDYLSAGMLGVGLLLPNALEKTGKYAVKTGLKYFPEATKSAYDIFHLYKTPKDNPRLRRYADDVVSLLKSDEMQARGWISSDRYLRQINNIQSAPAYFTHSKHTFIRPQFKLFGKEFTSPIPLPYGYRGMYSPNKHSFTVKRGKHTPDEIRHTAYHEASHASDRGWGTAGYMSIKPKENSLYYDMPTEKRARVISILADAYKNGININDFTELGNFINKNYINSNYSSLLKNYKTADGKSFVSNMLHTP